jgi:hypothetical protein
MDASSSNQEHGQRPSKALCLRASMLPHFILPAGAKNLNNSDPYPITQINNSRASDISRTISLARVALLRSIITDSKAA